MNEVKPPASPPAAPSELTDVVEPEVSQKDAIPCDEMQPVHQEAAESKSSTPTPSPEMSESHQNSQATSRRTVRRSDFFNHMSPLRTTTTTTTVESHTPSLVTHGSSGCYGAVQVESTPLPGHITQSAQADMEGTMLPYVRQGNVQPTAERVSRPSTDSAEPCPQPISDNVMTGETYNVGAAAEVGGESECLEGVPVPSTAPDDQQEEQEVDADTVCLAAQENDSEVRPADDGETLAAPRQLDNDSVAPDNGTAPPSDALVSKDASAMSLAMTTVAASPKWLTSPVMDAGQSGQIISLVEDETAGQLVPVTPSQSLSQAVCPVDISTQPVNVDGGEVPPSVSQPEEPVDNVQPFTPDLPEEPVYPVPDPVR